MSKLKSALIAVLLLLSPLEVVAVVHTCTTTSTYSTGDFSISQFHTGQFTNGTSGDTFTITVTNTSNVDTTPYSHVLSCGGGTVTLGLNLARMTETLSTGLSVVNISGVGWTCDPVAVACFRNDGLTPGESYPPITITVAVDPSAPASMVNTSTFTGTYLQSFMSDILVGDFILGTNENANTDNWTRDADECVDTIVITDAPAAFATLDQAYLSLLPLGTGTLFLHRTYYASETFDQDITVNVIGGYDCDFDTLTGVATIVGPVTISSGTVTFDGIAID